MKKMIKWVVVLVVLGGGAFWFTSSKVDKTEASGPSYDTASVELRDIRITVESTGEVEPRNRLDVKPPIAGRLEELMVDEGDQVEKGQILGWISSTERATLLDAALASGKDEYDYWADLYKPSPLISPLKGTIIARNFEPGQSIEDSDAIVVIADDLIVVANLDETDIGQIQNEQVVVVNLEAYPDREFPCVVEKIAYDAETVSNVTMYEVDVRPFRLPAFARSGMTANLEFVIEEKKGVLALPTSAIQQASSAEKNTGHPDLSNMSENERQGFMMERMRERGLSESEIKERLAGGGRPGDGQGGQKSAKRSTGSKTESYVLVASADPEKPEQVKITVGVSDGSYTEVLEGLQEGEEVLIQRMSAGGGGKSGGGGLFSSTMGGGPRR